MTPDPQSESKLRRKVLVVSRLTIKENRGLEKTKFMLIEDKV
jgi:hypothetical protein